jgi:competence protein ComEA
VAGAVADPGLHELPAGSRVAAAVAAAGGPVADADLDALNLAAPLADGQRLHVPRDGEPVEWTDVPAITAPRPPVDLNRATTVELETLPGVGPTIATTIVDDRAQHGPYASVDDLLRVRGIGPAKLEAIRPLVTV